MKQTKLKERFDKAFEVFFETPKDSNQIEVKQINQFDSETQNTQTKSKLKQIFKTLLSATVYIPSALLLGVFGFIFTLTEVFGVPSMMPMSQVITKYELIRLVLTLGGLAILSILGVGNIKNIKHLSIPLSITSIGSILGVLFGLATIFDPMLRHSFLFPPNDYNLFYFLPIFLVVGVLTKNWIDSLDEKKPN